MPKSYSIITVLATIGASILGVLAVATFYGYLGPSIIGTWTFGQFGAFSALLAVVAIVSYIFEDR